ncbi:hypothetical protein [Gluconacetobacter tumulisoli]|uniref:Uncharacterized protein n=1 Tax=Gluconacetobacter tumulisoli TaxID=1286189 RepID=A0A7W4K4B2_9PROT|nr:hypothetical protein [Gluconacetobacter tumulisoli]MBB2200013.1 hypothetical protein [Gluconacetobacter tumulisoli]
MMAQLTKTTQPAPQAPARRTRLPPAMSETIRAIHARHRQGLRSHARTKVSEARVMRKAHD